MKKMGQKGALNEAKERQKGASNVEVAAVLEVGLVEVQGGRDLICKHLQFINLVSIKVTTRLL